MKNLMIWCVLVVFSSSAFALNQKNIVYKIVSVEKSQSTSGWTLLNTLSNTYVGIRCKTSDFDDSVRDRVGAFKSTKECEQFLADVQKYANSVSPVDVKIGDDLFITYTINL